MKILREDLEDLVSEFGSVLVVKMLAQIQNEESRLQEGQDRILANAHGDLGSRLLIAAEEFQKWTN